MPAIAALEAVHGEGHQFVVYADCCSGIPGAPHEQNFAAINNILQRLDPQPEFICFPGDEVRGLVAHPNVLREQWQYWFEEEMAWLDRLAIPLYHTTGNHTVYDAMSASVYQNVMAHLPDNGPPNQQRLSYFVRRRDLLMVFVNTLWSGLGGEGRVETEWLEQILESNADARHKLVFGHHPVFAVNGFAGPGQREIESENGRRFWQVLVRHNVLAYFCSHILAFDVQVHDGVLQILSAGAGTMPRMPPDYEYLHLLQATLDDDGLRYQVLDCDGTMREWFRWPITLPPSHHWESWLDDGNHLQDSESQARLTIWNIAGTTSDSSDGMPQTLLCGLSDEDGLPPLWLGLRGVEQRLSLLLCPEPGRSPHLWSGPNLPGGEPFSIQIAIHGGMGPGGLLWRWCDDSPWTSMTGASPWGAERLPWPHRWVTGHGQYGPTLEPFRGEGLSVTGFGQTLWTP